MTAFELQLREDAQRLFENLCTGDGAHSEALDIGLIEAAFKNLLRWAGATPEAAPTSESVPYLCPSCAHLKIKPAYCDRCDGAGKIWPKVSKAASLRAQIEQLKGLPIEWVGRYPESYFKGHNAAIDKVLALLDATETTL